VIVRICLSAGQPVEVVSLGDLGVITAAFREVEIAGVLERGLDSRAEGGEVGRAVPDLAGGGTGGDLLPRQGRQLGVQQGQDRYGVVFRVTFSTSVRRC
jgi:hypothetical protein